MAPAVLLEEVRNVRPQLSMGEEEDQDQFTGERFLPGYSDGSIELQHVHRYAFALPFVVGRSVLDIACGEGYGCDLMGQVAAQVIGIDIDTGAIEMARKRYSRPNLQFKEGSTSAIPMPDGSVDVVVSFETLEHLVDQNAFWSEIKRVLKTGGMLVISSPNRDAYNEQRTTKNPFHTHELTQDELVSDVSRRFAHHQLFSQDIIFGSLLLPISAEAMPQTIVSVDPNTREITWQVGGEVRRPYLLAVASDKPVSISGHSVYTGRYPPNAMASLVGGIVERDHHVRELKSTLTNLDASRAALAAAVQRDEKKLTEQNEKLKEMHAELSEQKELLEAKRNEAVLREERLRETLSEQDKVIQGLKCIVDEYTKRLATSAASTTKRQHSVEDQN
jgi:2-polyprenyl-3-methyl-5-hydroxy-6-metoxy-1,4-benzoquinol methylase